MVDEGYEIISAVWANPSESAIRAETRGHGTVMIYNSRGREELWAHAMKWIENGGDIGPRPALPTRQIARDAVAELDALKAELREKGVITSGTATR